MDLRRMVPNVAEVPDERAHRVADVQTASQLRKLQRLVESLVLREYDAESPAISSSSRVDAAEGQLTGSRHAHVAYRPRGMGAEADRRARPPPDGFGDTAVPGKSRPTRLASLQEQLAGMREQLGVAYQELDARQPQQVDGLEQRYFGDRATAAAGAMPASTSVPPSPGLSTLNGVHHPVGGQARWQAAAGERPMQGGPDGGDASWASPARYMPVEGHVLREAKALEEERLRSWIQDLRSERRRLEDRLLEGDTSGVRLQQLRDDLEKQVLDLSRHRDLLKAELSELGITRASNAQLAVQVELLASELAVERERVNRYKKIRPALEQQLSQFNAALDEVRQQHAAALEHVGKERDAAKLKAKRALKHETELEGALTAAHGEKERLSAEVHRQALALEEVCAGNEALQSANRQLQVSVEAQANEAATRLAVMQAQLETSQSDAIILRRQVEALQSEAKALTEQLREAINKTEAIRADREQLGGRLVEEQQAAAAAKQQAEDASRQAKASEAARDEALRTAALKLEVVQRQHGAELAAMQKQYESQLAASDKQYGLLQRQYDAGLASSEQLADASSALRRERDALWAQVESLRAELEAVRQEKAEVTTKLTALRSDVRTTMDEVTRDRDAQLSTAASQQEALVRSIKAEAEQRVSSMTQEYEARLAGFLDVTDKLRKELAEAQQQGDKYRVTVGHLKEQVRDLLLGRDAAERELASERAFNHELNRILSAIRGAEQDRL